MPKAQPMSRFEPQRSLPPWTGAFPGKLPVPCQLDIAEIDFLHWLGASQWSGRGRVIELGPLFGGSTFALASGMKRNARAGVRFRSLISYDSFIAPRGLDQQFSVPVREGESFRFLFDRYLAPHLDHVEVREGWIPDDLPNERSREVYPEQDPVEILFIDCAKQWGVHLTILRAFGPRLIPGESILVSQDFKSGLPWLMLHMHQLRECFEQLWNVPGTTVAFRYVGGIERLLPELWRADELSHERADLAWSEVCSAVDATSVPDWSAACRLAHGRHLMLQSRHFEAAAVFEGACEAIEDALAQDPGAPWRTSLLFNWRMAMRAEARRVGSSCDVLQRRLARLARCVFPGEVEAEVSRAARFRDLAWGQLAEICAMAGIESVALYGAGKHTRDLLASGWPDGRINVRCIVDDHHSVG